MPSYTSKKNTGHISNLFLNSLISISIFLKRDHEATELSLQVTDLNYVFGLTPAMYLKLLMLYTLSKYTVSFHFALTVA